MLAGMDDKQLYEYIVKDPEGGPHCNKCTICGKTGNDRSNLRKHVENAHFNGVFSYECKYCPSIFGTRTKLNHHVTASHKSFNAFWELHLNLKYILVKELVGAFSCLLLPGDKQLYDYIEKAPECGPRGHRCTLCGKTGNDRGNLRKHVENVHFPGTFSYQCRHCPPPAAVFPTRTKLNNHMSAMHKSLPF